MSDPSPGFFRVDRNGVIRAWDEAMAGILGYAAEEVLGQSMTLLIPETYHERHWKGFRGAMSRGKPMHNQPALNVPFRHRDGNVQLYPAREIFLRDPFRNAIGVLAVVGPACGQGEVNGLPSPYADALDAE